MMGPFAPILEEQLESFVQQLTDEPNNEDLAVENQFLSEQSSIELLMELVGCGSSNKSISSNHLPNIINPPNASQNQNIDCKADLKIRFNEAYSEYEIVYGMDEHYRSEPSSRMQLQSQDEEQIFQRFKREHQEQIRDLFDCKEIYFNELITDKNLVYDPKPGFSRFNPNNLYCIQGSQSTSGQFYFDNPQQFQHLQPYNTIASITSPEENQQPLRPYFS